MKKTILILFVITIAFVGNCLAVTQTINAIPAGDATFIQNLQTFLRQEQAERDQLTSGDKAIVVSGGIGITSASLSHTIPACVGFPNNYYVSQNAVSHTYTAIKRTFVYLRDDDTRTIFVTDAVITYDGNFVFVELPAATARPLDPVGTLALMQVDTDGTSITSVLSLTYRQVINVRDFGAIPNDNVDDYAAIQSAIDYAGRIGGGIVHFETGKYLISQGLSVSLPNTFLQGNGYQWHSAVNAAAATQWTQNGGTILQYSGSSGTGTLLTFAPDVTGPTLHGVGYDGLILDGFGLANNGLVILSVRGGHFGQIVVADCLVQNIHIGCQPTAGWTSLDPNGTQYCNFAKTLSRVWKTAALSANGILIDGDDTADVSFCTFGEISYIHANGYGLSIKSSDACTFDSIIGYRIPTYTGYGMRLNGGISITDNPRKHHFGFIQAGTGGFRAVANTIAPAGIIIDDYSLGNGTSLPTIDKGSDVSYKTDAGISVLSRTGTYPEARTLRADGDSINQVISQAQVRAYNDAGTELVYSQVSTTIADPTAGSEDGTMVWQVVIGGSLTTIATLNSSGFKLLTGATLKHILTATANLDFTSVAANSHVDLTIAVAGATAGDAVVLGLPANGGSSGISYSAFVSSSDVVTVRATNCTSGAIDPANQAFRVTLFGS